MKFSHCLVRYGWVTFKTARGTKMLGHDGGNMIFFADFRRYIEENVVIFHATNSTNYNQNRISNSLAKIIFAKP